MFLFVNFEQMSIEYHCNPTGGGKSLVYQLPVLIDGNLTLVISPLLSLIEDQLIALRKLNINAASLNSSTTKDTKKRIYEYMGKGIEPTIKLLYVTPEWVAKSKMFMSYLQKCHAAKRLDRVAIGQLTPRSNVFTEIL